MWRSVCEDTQLSMKTTTTGNAELWDTIHNAMRLCIFSFQYGMVNYMQSISGVHDGLILEMGELESRVVQIKVRVRENALSIS